MTECERAHVMMYGWLPDVQIKVVNEKKRCMTLFFKERSLMFEATSAEQYDFLLQGFQALQALWVQPGTRPLSRSFTH